MAFYLVSTNRDRTNKIASYNVVDTNTLKVRSFTDAELINAINNNVHIENLTVANNKLVTISGSIDRYTMLYQDNKYNTMSLVVLAKEKQRKHHSL